MKPFSRLSCLKMRASHSHNPFKTLKMYQSFLLITAEPLTVQLKIRIIRFLNIFTIITLMDLMQGQKRMQNFM